MQTKAIGLRNPNDSTIRINDPVSIRAYFEKIRELTASGEKFPVNLDKVWPLVYSRKDLAVRALTKDFFEGEDYNLLQNEEVVESKRIQNGITVDYHLSLSCLEYFIARKVRAVFEVYRQVFQKAVLQSSQVPQTFAEALRLAADALEQKERLALENAQLKPKAEYTDKVLLSATELTTTSIAKEFGMSAYALNILLMEKKVQFRHDGHYVLYQKYASLGLANLRTHQFFNRRGESQTNHYLVWTESGRKFIHELLNTQLAVK